MSTATATPPIPHAPRTAHPLPLREQAFTLHCQGLRSPAIAQQLGVPERTIRAWIAATLDDLKEDHQLNRRQQLLLAVERQHAITAAAWQQFEAETAARSALLDTLLDACQHSPTSAASESAPSTGAAPSSAPSSAHTLPRLPHLPATVPAPRYLSLILQANRETNRLLGLYTLAKLELLASETEEANPIPLCDPDIAAESAAAPITNFATPAESATAPVLGLAAGFQPANPQSPASVPIVTIPSAPGIAAESATAADSPVAGACTSVGAHRVYPECPEATSPAESATLPSFYPSCPSVSSVSSVSSMSSASSVVPSRLPAKTATAPYAPIAAATAMAPLSAHREGEEGAVPLPAKTATASSSPHRPRYPRPTFAVPQPWMM